jgi:phosphatidylserine/phosphatidylglycerophosphate/cardiolipin synthase-like enzyme
LLVDAGNAASDPTLFVGSHNWSAAANTTNDENTFIFHDNAIVNRYYQEFSQCVTE